MRGVAHELPAAAAAKLTELQLSRDAALDAQRSAAMRANNLPADAGHLRAKLEAERDRHGSHHRTLSMLYSAVAQWHVQLRLAAGTILASAPPIDIKPEPGQTAAEAVAAIRAEIAAIKQQIAQVRAAPLRTESMMESVAIYLDGLMRQARPRIGFDASGRAKISFVEDMVVDKSSVLGLLAWVLGPEELASAFARDIEQEEEPANAVTPVERATKLRELGEALLELERKEAALLDDSIPPRPDMDPRAFLSVVIASAPAPAQVA
jgi:hypothetical protein